MQVIALSVTLLLLSVVCVYVSLSYLSRLCCKFHRYNFVVVAYGGDLKVFLGGVVMASLIGDIFDGYIADMYATDGRFGFMLCGWRHMWAVFVVIGFSFKRFLLTTRGQ